MNLAKARLDLLGFSGSAVIQVVNLKNLMIIRTRNPLPVGGFYHYSRHIFHKIHSLDDKNELHVVISLMIEFIFHRITSF